MRRTDGKNAGPARRGVAAAARAIGRAFGFLGLIRFRRRGCAAQETRETARAQRHLSVQRRALEVRIFRLEAELDQVYAQVVEGAGQVKRNRFDPATPELAKIIDLSRDLREQLRAKRAELTRLDRDAAREFRLQRAVPVAPVHSPEREKGRSVLNPPEEPSGPEQPAQDLRVRDAILKVSQRASFDDGSRRVIFEKLVGDLLVDDPEIRRTAAARLGELGAPAALDVLRAALDDPENNVRAAALNSLALLGDDSSAELFRRYSDSAEHHLRLASLRGLARVGDPRDDPAMLAAMEDNHPAVRKAAATYLGWREASGSTLALISALHDDEEEVRAAAAASLGNLHSDRAVLSLIRTLMDPDTSVREAAKTAIESILGEKIDVDVEAGGEVYQRRIEELKGWWKGARIDKQLECKEGPDLQEEVAEAEPPAQKLGVSGVSGVSQPSSKLEGQPSSHFEGAPRGVDPAGKARTTGETAATREPAKVVDLKSVAASRTRPGAVRKQPGEQAESGKEKEAIEEPKSLWAAKSSEKKEAEAEPEEVEATSDEVEAAPEEGEMPAELEGLGTIKASEETKADGEEMPEGLDGLGIRVADGKTEEKEGKTAPDEGADEDKQEGEG